MSQPTLIDSTLCLRYGREVLGVYATLRQRLDLEPSPVSPEGPTLNCVFPDTGRGTSVVSGLRSTLRLSVLSTIVLVLENTFEKYRFLNSAQRSRIVGFFGP